MAPARSALKTVPRRIGLLGGTFNPVHWGHLKAARAALQRLRLDQVVFLPCARPALKDTGGLMPAGLRLRLLRLAVGKQKKFLVDGQEIARGGVSYTIDTLRAYRKKWKDKAEIFFLLGVDAALELSRWKQCDELKRYCRICVLRRPGINGKIKRLPLALIKRFSLLLVNTPLIPISSTDIRNRIMKKKSLKGKVPREIGKILSTWR